MPFSRHWTGLSWAIYSDPWERQNTFSQELLCLRQIIMGNLLTIHHSHLPCHYYCRSQINFKSGFFFFFHSICELAQDRDSLDLRFLTGSLSLLLLHGGRRASAIFAYGVHSISYLHWRCAHVSAAPFAWYRISPTPTAGRDRQGAPSPPLTRFYVVLDSLVSMEDEDWGNNYILS